MYIPCGRVHAAAIALLDFQLVFEDFLATATTALLPDCGPLERSASRILHLRLVVGSWLLVLSSLSDPV